MFNQDELIDNAILIGYKFLCGDCNCLTTQGGLCCKCGMNPYKCISNQNKLTEARKDGIKQYIERDSKGFDN